MSTDRNTLVINRLFANAMKDNKIRITRKSKDIFALQANIGGVWMTLEQISVPAPTLKVVDSST